MKFYALYSKSQERYCAPFLAHDEEEAKAQLTHMVVSSQDTSLIMSLDDLRLDCIGRFSPAAGYPVDRLLPVTVVKDLTALPLPPLVREKVDQLYKKKQEQKKEQKEEQHE